MEAPPPPAQALTLAREARGWTQRELAEAAGVSQAVLSKVESGVADLGGRVGQVADALGCPASMLVDGLPVIGSPVTCVHHRRRTSRLSAKAQKRVQALAQLTRVSVTAMIDAAGEHPIVDDLLAHRFALAGAVEAALAVRHRFDLGADPITNAIDLVERTGTVVVLRSLGPNAQDAVSSWADAGDAPLVVVNTGLSVDRRRFTVLHEMAHILLHVIPDEGQELDAHRFAAEVLFPTEVATSELSGLAVNDFRRLVELKKVWGVSVGALIQRAADVGCISAAEFKEMRIRLTRLGWHRVEPVDLPDEQPTRLKGYVARARQRGLSDKELAAAAQMTLLKFRSETWLSGAAAARER
jgi:Zn-dependent peptidase ImmA (M78 family)/transcriptional regulator with XRE-family HTH domain